MRGQKDRRLVYRPYRIKRWYCFRCGKGICQCRVETASILDKRFKAFSKGKGYVHST